MMLPTLVCNKCGADNQPQATFCRSCGYSLQAVKPTTYHSATGRLLAKSLLKQRYRIISPIGTGGMGAVYQAEDTQLGDRQVALKEMSQSRLSPQEQKEAADTFRQEAITLARLQHPNLPSIFDHFEENGRWYLVMSFIEGETLDDYLSHAQGGKLPRDEALKIGMQLCTVLGYLHTRQPAIIFRDLKPANIMHAPDGHIYLIDFGIARHFKPGQAKDTAYYGSMGYAPPEQYGKAQTTPRSDIYSLGVVLYQLLSGHDPSTTPFRFPSLQSLVPTIPIELAILVTHMLELDANRRPSSVLIIGQKLQSLTTSPSGTPLAPPTVLAATPLLQPTIAVGTPPSPPKTPIVGLPKTQVQTFQPSSKQMPKAAPKTALFPLTRLVVIVLLAVLVLGGGFALLSQLTHSISPSSPASSSSGNRIYTYTGFTDTVNTVTWSPNGKFIAAGSNDKTIQVWDANSGNHIATYTGNSSVASIAWSPNSRYIVAGYAEGLAQVWDTSTGNKTVAYTGHTGSITFVAWSSDENFVASGSTDKTVQVWNALNGKELVSYTNQTNLIKCMAWSPDGNSIASGSDNILQVWDAHNANKIAYIATGTGMGIGPISVTWSPDSKYIAAGLESGNVQIWNATSGEKVAEYNIHNGGVFAVAWSPDGKHIASGGSDTIAYIWDANSGIKTMTYSGHSNKVNSVSWSPDSKRIASASDDTTVQVWQVG